jgi:hypothetical protein
MAAVYSQAWLRVVAIPGRLGAVTIVLVLGVAAWWLLMFGLMVLVSAPSAIGIESARLSVEAGQLAHIFAPPLVAWAIPESRVEFDAYNLAVGLDDEQAMEAAMAATWWIAVADHQMVRVVQIDGAASQVEVLEGPYVGRAGWVPTRHLVP